MLLLVVGVYLGLVDREVDVGVSVGVAYLLNFGNRSHVEVFRGEYARTHIEGGYQAFASVDRTAVASGDGVGEHEARLLHPVFKWDAALHGVRS